jgi:glycerol-3-phosphate acyltransferase PlsY
MWFFMIAAAYLLGSIPFPYLVTRLKTGKDIRDMGSGNVGATNVMRTSGKTLGLLTLFLDVAKGGGAVLLGRFLLKEETAGAVAGFCAVVGHSYPIFLKFRGGKSVATGGGAFLMLSPLGIISSIGVFGALLLSFRIVSLSSMIASAAFPLFAWLYGASPGIVLWGALSAALIIFRHKPNIIRLLQRTERRLGDRKNA